MTNDSNRNNGENDLEAKESYWNWKEFKTNVVKASETGSGTKVRGRKLLDAVDRWFRKLDGITLRNIPEEYHPFTQSGAIANFMFVIAVLTGFALLIWYSPSVHYAYDSVAAMSEQPYTAELMRSLHRYSSDAFMLFVLFHAFKVFFAGRFTGSRWLAWVTGIIGLGIIWFDGWLGYWLVWDDRAAMIATATAKMLDVLPIFAEPLKASFLTDDSFNSVLFVIVFFLHMLIPIGFGIAIWLHVSRLNGPVFITSKKFSALLLVSLVVISLTYPADIGSRADLMSTPEEVRIDYFYLMPLILTERLQGGILWLIALGAFVLIASIPWMMSRRQTNAKPLVDEIKCNGCTQCFYDCPYNAISMNPREKGNPKKSEYVANIDPSVCVSCGICVGSCDPVAIEYPNLSPWDIRRKLDSWLDDERSFEGEHVAFVCGNSAGSSLTIDPKSGRCKEMPGYLVCTLPCAGWIHPTLIERALKNNADGVLVAGCESDPDFRLGADWLGSRIEGDRHPEFRKDRFEMDRILFLKMDKPEFRKFLSEAQRFRQHKQDPAHRKKGGSTVKKATTGVVIAVLIAGLAIWPSSAELPLPDRDSELVISFKKQGAPIFADEEEDESERLQHMQRQDGPRVVRRTDVVVQVTADGSVVHEEHYRPKGIFRRGYSSGIIQIPLRPGNNQVEIRFGYQLEDEIDWIYTDEQDMEIEKGARIVMKFDEQHGYRWYGTSE